MKKIPLLPVPEGMRVRIFHLHNPGEVMFYRLGKRPPPRYVTIAELFDSTGKMVMSGCAYCSHRDNPSRKMGRAIAHNRAVGRYLKEHGAADRESETP